MRKELRELFDAGNEENVLYGPDFILPKSMLRVLLHVFIPDYVPPDRFKRGWDPQLLKEPAAYATESLFDAALKGLVYRWRLWLNFRRCGMCHHTQQPQIK